MLDHYFNEGLALGLAQAAVTFVAAFAVALLARRWEIHLERETLVALVRGLVRNSSFYGLDPGSHRSKGARVAP